MRSVTVFTAAVLAAAVAAPAASAGQFVVVQGGNVVAMKDDGSGARAVSSLMRAVARDRGQGL